MPRKVWIIGTRGVPASHGGFETFAERLALYLQQRGWEVLVFCQHLGKGKTYITQWRGVTQVNVFSRWDGPLGTLSFDAKCIFHAARTGGGIALVLGYNSAILNLLLRLRKIPVLINMDGFEWRRDKWSLPFKIWFYLNERLGVLFANKLVLDHPEIAKYFADYWPKRPQAMIPYGGDADQHNDETLSDYQLEQGQYYLIIARPEPENSILEIVEAYVQSGVKQPLVVLGNYRDTRRYHQAVKNAAKPVGGSVRFVGAIYDLSVTTTLRVHCRAYIHGHTVGGTNPSLVEALAAGSPVIAHDNRFNRWVAGDHMRYFTKSKQLADIFATFSDNDVTHLQRCAFERHQQRFTWQAVLNDYEQALISSDEQ